MTVGVINVSQMGIGLLFSVAMLTGGFGTTVAMLQVSTWNLASLGGISLFKSSRSLASVNLLGPFLHADTGLFTFGCRGSFAHTIVRSTPSPSPLDQELGHTYTTSAPYASSLQ